MAGTCGIPADAKALAVNVTVVNSTASGELSIYPGNLAPPDTSLVAFSAGVSRAGNGIVTLATDGSGSVKLEARLDKPGSLAVLLDVTGYFQ